MKTFVSLIFGLTLSVGASQAQEASNKYAPLAYRPMGMVGQALVDMETAKHPEIKILTIHVTPPGIGAEVDKERRLMFSNIGRIGKVDNDADGEVFRGGKEVVEVQTDPTPVSANFSITATPKYEVLTPLKDNSGKNVGLVAMVFPYHEKFDLEQYHKIAQDVVAELSSRTSNRDDLFRPALEAHN